MKKYYYIIFILLSRDKVYYIRIKTGNDQRNYYYIYKRHELCIVHNSNYCGCRLNIPEKNFKKITEKYVNLYKFVLQNVL